ncbi:hypothetical protein LCGC14_2196300 [marine sediment metagenome]|uniref:Uncharacterized protein n=1 Tax=marine sediment metagenome TaxID=412755 RepID=A0A0F9DI27_9ZZZZ
MSEICDACRKIAMYTVTIGDRDGLSMVVCEECTKKAWDEVKFKNWMIEVDDKVMDEAGVSVNDLPSCTFRPWFDEKLSPEEVAEMALGAAKWPGYDSDVGAR